MPVTIVGNNTPTAGGVVYGDGTNYASTAAGTSGQVLQSNGSSAPSWITFSSTPNLVRSARTSNTILGTADKGTLIAITSGTFTQTFTAAATLGSGWWCYIQNAGTGEITLDPNASETIDGLTSYIMYPNEVRLVQCDGSNFFTLVIDPFYTTYTASGSFTKPPGYTLISGYIWGGGGGGSRSGGGGFGSGGGGGGACRDFILLASSLSTSTTVTIGAGGTSGINTGASPSIGSPGGNSSFGSITAYGGGGGYGSGNGTSGGGGGGGGGQGAAGTTASGAGGGSAGAGIGPTATTALFAGTTGNTSDTAYWGGGGGHGTPSGAGAQSIWGGGGGGAGSGSATPAGGSSTYGGAGGNGGNTGVAGTAPGGGGGGGNTTGADGARGELRIWGII